MTTEDNCQDEQPLLTSVDVVCREIPSFKTHPHVVRRTEQFLDYASQYGLHGACSSLPLRLVKRVYLSEKWDQEQVVSGLSYAAMEGKLEVIKWLCEKEKDKGVATKTLVTGFNQRVYCYIPVCLAALKGHVHVLQWLVNNGADVNEKDYTGQTALLAAASGGHFSTVQWLIENGARVNDADRDGDTVLHEAVSTGNLDLVKYLVGQGAKVEQTNDCGMSVLHYAVSTAVANEALVHFFLSSGFQPSDADKQGRTALHYASVARNFGIMKCLLEVGFKESKPPVNDLQRAFVEAVKADRLDLVNYLIDYGVDMHFVSFRGWNILHEAAAAGGRVNLIKFLLEKGVNAQLADKFGINPLMEACRHGHNEILVCLLGAGGKVGDVDLAGQSALHLAAQGGHTDIVKLLLKNEADVHCCDQRGWTPLHSAAAAGKNCEIIDLLIANDAKFDAKTLSGQTAEDLAICVGHADAASNLKHLHASNTKSGVPGYSDDSWLGTPIALKVGKLKWNKFGEALEAWSQLNHPHIERIYDNFHPDDAKQKPHFVCERTSCEELYGYLDSDKADMIAGIWEKMYQVALGLQHLHDRNMIRGPLSSYDVFIALNGVAKLNLFDQDARDHVPWCTAPEVLAGLPASFKSDIFAFGFIIIDAIKRGARIWCPSYDDDAILSGKLPSKPNTMTASQWKLVEQMCCYNFRERLSIADVVHELEGITSSNTLVHEVEEEKLELNKAMMNWATTGEHWVGECTLSDLLHEIGEMCVGSTTINQMNRDVYDRLIDIFKLLSDSTDPIVDVVQGYSNVVRYFHARLQMTSTMGAVEADQLAGYRQGTDDVFTAHNGIDTFAESSGLSLTSQVHQWRELWDIRRRQQKHEMVEKLENLSGILQDAEVEKEREEILTHLRFELSKHPNSYATSKAADFIHAKSMVVALSATTTNPSWFIPAHEVHFDKFDEFNRGAFGKVYHGRWKGSRVVVKKVKLRNEEDHVVFLKEVEIWHKFYHQNVVQLYGAYHFHKPFFVCEFASNGQLDQYLRKYPNQVWEMLYEAALGLQYLHMKQIIHGDLKCNNILVGSDGKAKLTDFGLSVMEAIRAESESETEIASGKKSIGAIRWKAPEVLRGEKSTFASDVYSFGMCILESVSGKFPWGMTMDPVVEYYVVKQQRIPRRPEDCSEEAYALVERMCRFEPSKRILMNQVVDALKELR